MLCLRGTCIVIQCGLQNHWRGEGWAPNELQIDPPKWMIHPPQKKILLETSLLSPNDRPPGEISALPTPPKWKFVMTTLSDCDSNDIQRNRLLDIGSCCHLNGIYKMVLNPRHPSWILSLASNIFPWNPRNFSSLNVIFSWNQIVTKKKTSNH